MASTATAHSKTGAPRRTADGQVFGALLLVFGLGWMLRVSGAVELDWKSLVAVVLIVLGVGMAITARARGGLLMVLGILLTISLATTSSIGEVDFVGDRRERPTSFAALEEEYNFFGGSLELDLTAVQFPVGLTTVDVSMGGGQIQVIVPEGVAVSVDARLGGGEIQLFDQRDDGPSPRGSYVDQDYGDADTKLHLELSGGGGKIEVRRASETEDPGAPDAAG
jgi:predicted membrane protein